MGNALDAIEGGGLLMAIVELVPLDTVYLGGIYGVLPVHAAALFPDSYAEDVEVVTVILFPNGFDVGEFGLAGRAPGRPEVYEEHFALTYEVGEALGLVNGLAIGVQTGYVLYGEVGESLALGGSEAGVYILLKISHEGGILALEGGRKLIEILGKFCGLDVGVDLLESLYAHSVIEVGLESSGVVLEEGVVSAVGESLRGLLLIIGEGSQTGAVVVHEGLVPLVELGHLFFHSLGFAAHQHSGGCH